MSDTPTKHDAAYWRDMARSYMRIRNELTADVATLKEQLTEANAKVAALEKDAARYRSARERAEHGPWEMENGEDAVVVFLPIPDAIKESGWDSPEIFDAAIDAAQQPGEQTNG